MPETYDGTEGTAAAAAGYSVLSGGEQWRTGWRAINKTRDMLAALKTSIAAVWPVAKGGTGATTAAAARTNLGLDATVAAVAAATPTGTGNTLALRTADGRINVGNPTGADNAANKRYVDSISETSGGFEVNGNLWAQQAVIDGRLDMGGQIYVPNSVAADSGYVIAYINNNGRLSKGASSERYKANIAPVDPAGLGDLFGQLYTFTMRMDGDNTPRYGDIAERLAESDDLRPFVVYDPDGLPDSIDFLALLRCQTAQLHERLAAAEATIAQLRGAK